MKQKEYIMQKIGVVSRIVCDGCGRVFPLNEFDGSTIAIEKKNNIMLTSNNEDFGRMPEYEDPDLDMYDIVEFDMCNDCMESKFPIMLKMLDGRRKDLERSLKLTLDELNESI